MSMPLPAVEHVATHISRLQAPKRQALVLIGVVGATSKMFPRRRHLAGVDLRADKKSNAVQLPLYKRTNGIADFESHHGVWFILQPRQALRNPAMDTP